MVREAGAGAPACLLVYMRLRVKVHKRPIIQCQIETRIVILVKILDKRLKIVYCENKV